MIKRPHRSPDHLSNLKLYQTNDTTSPDKLLIGSLSTEGKGINTDSIADGPAIETVFSLSEICTRLGITASHEHHGHHVVYRLVRLSDRKPWGLDELCNLLNRHTTSSNE